MKTGKPQPVDCLGCLVSILRRIHPLESPSPPYHPRKVIIYKEINCFSLMISDEIEESPSYDSVASHSFEERNEQNKTISTTGKTLTGQSGLRME